MTGVHDAYLVYRGAGWPGDRRCDARRSMRRSIAPGRLAGLRRVLAVDGFDVLSVHEDDVALDQMLLAQHSVWTERDA